MAAAARGGGIATTALEKGAQDAPARPLTQRSIFGFFLPLALSWALMGLEGPMTISIVSRMPDPKVSTAALLIMMSISFWIEAPVIDLLSTSTTLAKGRASYLVLSRFAWWLIGWVALAHACVALIPGLYLFVTRSILGVPVEVVDAARSGLIIMIPWSGFIGWRRFLQGVLIRHGRTRVVGMGTFIRLSTIAIVGFTLYFTSSLSAVAVAATALVSAVAAEALFVHAASRRTVRLVFSVDNPDDPGLTFKKLLAFHLPLTGTTMVLFLGGPIVSGALSRSPEPTMALGAWQVASTVIWLFRSMVFALPEAVITLYKDEQSKRALRRFAITLGLALSVFLPALYLLGMDKLIFMGVLGSSAEVAQVSGLAMLLCAALPLIGAVQSFVRGLLTWHHLTFARLWAILFSVGSLLVLLSFGVYMQWPGVVIAACGLTLSQAIELGVLSVSWARHSRVVTA